MLYDVHIFLFQTTIPHAYATIDCSMKAVTKLRKDLAGIITI